MTISLAIKLKDITFYQHWKYYFVVFWDPFLLVRGSHVRMSELDHKESWAPKNWCFWTVMLEKTLESPLDCTEIQPIYSKGNQSCIFIRRTDVEAPILWPPDGKNWLIEKDPDAGKGWRREKKGMTEDEMVGWHHWLDGHEFEQAWYLVMDREPWHAAVHGVAKSRTWLSNWTELIYMFAKLITGHFPATGQ